MHGWMDGRMDGCMDAWMDGWMDGRMDGWTSVCARIYACIFSIGNVKKKHPEIDL